VETVGKAAIQTSLCRWNEDYVSKHFERWKELAAMVSTEQDSKKLAQLANEMNVVLSQKTQYLDPPQREPSE
jgi:hypothetical protein